jgi:hypothetical protein
MVCEKRVRLQPIRGGPQISEADSSAGYALDLPHALQRLTHPGLIAPSHSAARSGAIVVGLGEADSSAGYTLDLSQRFSGSLTPSSPSPATAPHAPVPLSLASVRPTRLRATR